MNLANSKLITTFLLLILTVSGATAQLEKPILGFDYNALEVKIGEAASYYLTAKNDLNKEDNLTLRISNKGVQLGCKIKEITSVAGQIDCQGGDSTCRVPIAAESRLEIPFQLTGKTGGETTLIFRVRSERTGLTDEERIKVAVTEGNIGHPAPALNMSYLTLMLLVSAAFYAFYWR